MNKHLKAIFLTNGSLLLIGPSRTNFSEIGIKYNNSIQENKRNCHQLQICNKKTFYVDVARR